jgi:DNA-binding CsgD family transcriptional regulator
MESTRLLGLIDRIYASAEDSGLWGDALAETAGLFDACAVAFSAEALPSGAALAGAAHGLDPSFMRDYERYYSRVNVLVDLARVQLPRRSIVLTQDLVSDTELLRFEYYQDFLQRQNIFYGAGGLVAVDSTAVGLIHVMRTRRTGPFGQEDSNRLEFLLPHLRRAIRLHGLANALLQAEQSLNRSAMGVILIRGGQIEFASAAARHTLDRRDGLAVRDGRLAAATRGEQAQLDRLLASAARRAVAASDPRAQLADPVADPEDGVMAVARPSGGRPYSLRIASFRPPGASPLRRPGIIVFITGADEIAPPSYPVLRSLYGLTSTEAKVATRLMQGYDLKRICDDFSIRKTTARAHLRSVFGKVGVRRQSELVAVLSQASGGVRT